MAVVTGLAETFTAAARAASSTVGADEVRGSVMSIMGTQALVCYRLDDSEHARRQQAGTGVIRSADVLNLLLGLPVALPVSIASLTRCERAALKLVPPGAVARADGQVIRHAVAPVAVELALVAARSWRTGLEVAGRFTPFCSPAMVLFRRPVNVDEVCLQAGFYGVGVIVVDDLETEVLVEPARFRRRRFTAAGWRFLEEVYRKVR